MSDRGSQLTAKRIYAANVILFKPLPNFILILQLYNIFLWYISKFQFCRAFNKMILQAQKYHYLHEVQNHFEKFAPRFKIVGFYSAGFSINIFWKTLVKIVLNLLR